MSSDPVKAREHYDFLKAYSHTIEPIGVSRIDRFLGMLAQTMGNFDIAVSHFESALAFCRKAGYRPEYAWTCHDYANALVQRHRAGDQHRALALLDKAIAIATELGMNPLMKRSLAIKEQATLTRQAIQYPDGLTLREVEVLRLIAQGKTDREIGEELFISVRTAGNHVRNILNKTTTSNRTEAASYANRHGLV